MNTVTVHKAKTELSKLLARVEKGEEIVIARGSQPVAKLVPILKRRPVSEAYGVWKGRVTILDSFFDPLTEEEQAMWEGPIEPPT